MNNFEIVYKENADDILKYVSFKIQNFETAQEITNDVFMKVHKHWKNFDRKKSSMRTWIINIAKNTVIDYFRMKKENTISLDAYKDDENLKYKTNAIFLKVTSPSPYQLITSKETITGIQKEIISLPKQCKRIANLYFNHGMKYKAIANKTGMTLCNVKVTIHRSRKLLTKKLTI